MTGRITSHSIAEIARALGAEADGDVQLRVTRPAHPGDAGPDDLALAMDPEYAGALADSAARAAVLWPGADWRALGLKAAIFAPRSRYAMAGLTAAFQHMPHAPEGVHPTASVDPAAEIAEGASIGPFVWIGPGARLGPRARVLSHASIAEHARIGADALIHAGVRIGAQVTIGARVIIHANAVIGADGFSFVTPERGSVEAAKSEGEIGTSRNVSFARIHSLAAVTVGDDVEIGACATIDRGTVMDTRVGDGTKIDNLVQIGHNVRVGDTCLICAQVGVAGSTRIGNRVVLGGKAGIADHADIGDDSVIAAKAGVSGKVAPGSVLLGSPALPRNKALAQFRALARLPRLMEKLSG